MGVDIPPTLTHYLQGGYIPKNNILSVRSSSAQYILVLNSLPAHVVVFTGIEEGTETSATMINYYDPQNNRSGQRRIEGIANVYKATYFNR
jgi:hypothetical protein